ncbi:macrophage migration inhibitory factor family protein [Histomonas meleagridis]|uniref:macrophage migration inhibitory factor family protein n=1 Tax=Histomonas meleagridis TaxID=135588 RepID=UPI003559DE53|nr:macrophage migration inhibitory factor family protein [Histomonas meleagridis]
MPCLQVFVNFAMTQEQKAAASEALSKMVAKLTGKPEFYVMVLVNDNVEIRFGGDREAKACFMDLRSIGCISKSQNKKYSAEFTKYMGETFGVAHNRIYISFADAPGQNWGYDGDTFA